METTQKTIDVLNDLIGINNDRTAGFEKAAGALDEKDQDLKPVMLKLATDSRNNSLALAALVSRLGGDPATGTTFTGTMHRTWLDVEAMFTGSDRKTVLAECERGEDAIKQAYRDALQQANELDQEVVDTVRLQEDNIIAGHNLVKSLRDSADRLDGRENNSGNAYNEPDLELAGDENSFERVQLQEQQSGEMGYNDTIIAEDESDPQFNFENNYQTERGLRGAALHTSADNSKLKEFFIEELKDLLWAENKLVDTLPKMAEAAHSETLRDAFMGHLNETKQHVARLEQIFGTLGLEPDTNKCDAMAGIVDEGEEIIDNTEEGTAQRDVGLIFAGQKAEHYEIASYGGMVALAKTLGYEEVASILIQTLEEEKQADIKLSQIAENSVNNQAAGEQG